MTIFKGFEAARYQQHDSTIRELVLDFNANKAARCGCTEEQALRLTTLDEDVVKAWMIQESGGGDARSLDAWRVDPVQVNVPGDWNDYKSDLGITRPVARNEGDLSTNLKAGIILLARKGFGKSGQPPQNRASASFDGWAVALQRYNGRTDTASNGSRYSDNYSATILRRAANAATNVAIEIG